VIGCIILAGVFYGGAVYTYWRGEITLRGTGKVYKGDPRFRMAIIVMTTIGSVFWLFGALAKAKII
jgi:hypothetical protein